MLSPPQKLYNSKGTYKVKELKKWSLLAHHAGRQSATRVAVNATAVTTADRWAGKGESCERFFVLLLAFIDNTFW